MPTSSAKSAQSCVLRLGGQQISLPGPSGFELQKQDSRIYQAAKAWLTPPETVFAIYARSNPPKSSNRANVLQSNNLVIVSARPEFSDLNLSAAQFSSMRNDLTLAHNVWQGSAPADFAPLWEGGYRELAEFKYSLGVYRQNKHSISVARIVKNRNGKPDNPPASGKGTRPDANGSALSHTAPYLQLSGEETAASRSSERELKAAAERFFAGGDFTLSICNVLYARGRIFNIYFNLPLCRLDDIKPALEANAKYIETIKF